MRPSFGPLVMVAALLAGCTGSGREADRAGPVESSTPTSAEAVGTVTASAPEPASTLDLRDADLVRRRYRISCPGGDVEVDAAATSGIGIAGTPLAVSGFVARFADLTGDGAAEALLPVKCSRAGDPNSTVDSVVVVAMGPVGPAQMGGPILGRDPVAVGGSIAVARGAPGPGELPCCSATVRWESVAFVDGAWVPHSRGAPATEGDVAVPEGLGSLSIGGHYAELAVTSGQTIEVTAMADDGACDRISLPGGLASVSGWGGDGALQALVIGNPAVRTVEGLGIGSPEGDVVEAHEGELEVNELGGGALQLVHVPAGAPELVTAFRVEAQVVVEIAVGRRGWAEGSGGCIRG